MASLGDLLGLAHVLKRAYDLYQGCDAAPQEIRLARDHIHAMTLCLEGVSSDLLKNPRSFVHLKTDLAKSQTHSLKVHVGTCERALKRMGRLLQKYEGFKGQHVSLWQRYLWSTEGKKEIAECKSDLVLATCMLDMFLGTVRSNVLYKVEAMMEALMGQWAAMDGLFELPNTAAPRTRPRAGSNVTRTILVSLVLTKLRKALQSYRRKKTGAVKKPHPGPRRPKTVTRTNSGFMMNIKRNNLLHTYASNLANATPPPPHTPRRSNPRPRTPSPDFHYIPGGTATSPIPGPIRRSSSLNRLTARLNARVVQPIRAVEHYACWKVGTGTLAIGLKTATKYLQHKRGQLQLRKMGEVFKEASALDDSRALTEKDKRVKALLSEKNKKVRKGGKKWYFVSGRVTGRDPGQTGMVTVEKALVILVKR
jgi:hypothetical protein